jgi:U6 snRNA phosphodiesterase
VRLPLHISLSAPLVLETEQKDSFLNAVKNSITNSEVRCFSVRPSAVSWVPNFDKTRYFLVLKLTRPQHDELNKLLRACNDCAGRINLAELYHSATDLAKSEPKDDCFHISIAWTVQKPSENAQLSVDGLLPDSLQDTEVSFSMVKLKIGNMVHDLSLLAGTAGK